MLMTSFRPSPRHCRPVIVQMSELRLTGAGTPACNGLFAATDRKSECGGGVIYMTPNRAQIYRVQGGGADAWYLTAPDGIDCYVCRVANSATPPDHSWEVIAGKGTAPAPKTNNGHYPAEVNVLAEVRSRRQSGLPSCLSPDSVPPPKRTQAEVQDRGPCTVCGKSVMTNQDRTRSPHNGNYQHTACGDPTADSAVGQGSIEFLGLWRDSRNRAMPIKMGCKPGAPDQIRSAFASLISEMKAKGVTSGIIAAQSFNQMHWSANPCEAGYKKHGFIGKSPGDVSRSSWSKRVHRSEGMHFDGFNGVIDILGGDWQNAVYKVTLATGRGRGRGRGGGGGGGGGTLSVIRAWYGGPAGHSGQIRDLRTTAPWLWAEGERKGKLVTAQVAACVQNGALNFNPDGERDP